MIVPLLSYPKAFSSLDVGPYFIKKMSYSSRDASPISASNMSQFTMSSEKFTLDLPSPLLSNAGSEPLVSPPLKSPTGRMTQTFGRDGVLGSAKKARNLSQSSDRDSIFGLPNGQNSDDGQNPLKRRSTEAGMDYPRRRATIAVRKECKDEENVLMHM